MGIWKHHIIGISAAWLCGSLAIASPFLECSQFYTKIKVLSPDSLGPVARDLQQLFKYNDAELAKAFNRLSESEKAEHSKEKLREQELIKQLTDSKIPLKQSEDHIKVLIKNKILFSKLHEDAFISAMELVFKGSLYDGVKKSRTRLDILETYLTSTNEADKGELERFIIHMVEKIQKEHYQPQWKELNPAQKETIALQHSKQIGLSAKEDIKLLVSNFNSLQDVLDKDTTPHLISSIVRRSLHHQIKSMYAHLPTWKTRVGNVAIGVAPALTSVGLYQMLDPSGFGGQVLLPLSTILGSFLSIGWPVMDSPVVAIKRARNRFASDAKSNEQQLTNEIIKENGLRIIEAQIKLDELREDQEDFSFNSIRAELESGLASRDFYKLSIWGTEFQKGFSNLSHRQVRLDQRLDLISDQLRPLISELEKPTQDFSVVSSHQKTANQALLQIQNLLIDYAFLRSDYLSIAMAFDKYTDAVLTLDSDSIPTSEQSLILTDKLSKFSYYRDLIVKASGKTNGARNQVLALVRVISRFEEAAMMNLVESIRKDN